MKRLSHLLAATTLFCCAMALEGQAMPTATKAAGNVQVGVTYSNASPDLGIKRIGGGSIYATADLYKNFGFEVDVHLLQFQTPNDFAERTYLAGFRYSRHYHRYQPYVKALGGFGATVAQEPYVRSYIPDTPEHFAAFAFGAGLDMRLSHNINLRPIDYEQQLWPGYGAHGLTPRILSVGVAYRFF